MSEKRSGRSRRIVSTVTVQDRAYRLNTRANVNWGPVPFLRDDPALDFRNTAVGNGTVGGTTALGTFFPGANYDAFLGDGSLFLASITAGSIVIFQLKVDGTIRRRWLQNGIGELEVNESGSPLDHPMCRVPAGGTLIVELVFIAAGTVEAGFNAFVARY